MKMMKGKKKFLIAFVALLVAGITLAVTVFHDTTDVVATTAVFDGISAKYTVPKKQVNILEVVPVSTPHTGFIQDASNVEFNNDEASELGYFLTTSNDPAYANSKINGGNAAPEEPFTVTRGGVHGFPVTTTLDNGRNKYNKFDNNDKKTNEYKATLLNFYEYGIIKPSGVDGGYYSKLGEYPIYAYTAVFSQFSNGLFTDILGSRLVNGYYVTNTSGTGKYKIDDDLYGINPDDQNRIYNVTVSRNSLNEIVSVSYNSVVDIDVTTVSLPRKVGESTPIISYVDAGNGNLDFYDAEGVAVPYQLYKGYSKNAAGEKGNIYYSTSDQTRYHSSDWWNEYVLGDLQAYEDAKLDTPYKVMAANQVTAADVDWADFIYISGTHEAYVNANVDLDQSVMLKIYNDEINYKHKAVMMDYALYDDSLDNNISKLALLLWQKSQSETHAHKFVAEDGTETATNWFTKQTVTDDGKEYEAYFLNAVALGDDKLISYLKENKVPDGTGNGNFVTGNTYVYNHHMTDFKASKSMVDALDVFANGDFNSAYSDSVVTSGLTAVSKYIENSNANAITKMVSNSISPAVCIQYILVSTGADLDAMKLSLNILEIEPVPAYLYNTGRGSREFAELNASVAAEKTVIANRQAFVRDYLSTFYSDRIPFIHFTSMTVSEFNARNEDLVETYDIIYIGDETTRSNSYLYFPSSTGVKTNEWNETDKKYKEVTTKNYPTFRDANMLGNLYYNIGDKQLIYASRKGGSPETWEGLSGWLNGQRYTGVAKDTSTMDIRYAGRDLTSNKLQKMKDFLDSNALVLVSENLLGTKPTNAAGDIPDTRETVVNPTVTAQDVHGRVDSSSNLYAFLQYGLGNEYVVDYTAYNPQDNPKTGSYENVGGERHKNMVAVSELKQEFANDDITKEDLVEFVSTKKLGLNLITKPAEYGYTAYETGANAGVIKTQTYLDANNGRRLEYTFTILSDDLEDTFRIKLYVDVNKDGKYSKTSEDVSDVVITHSDGTALGADEKDYKGYALKAGTTYKLTREIAESYAGLINWKLDIQSDTTSYMHASEHGYTLVKPADNNKQVIKILQITNDTDSQRNLDLEARLYKKRTGATDGNNKNWGIYLDEVPDYEVYVRTMTIVEFQDAFNNAYAPYRDIMSAEDYALLACHKAQGTSNPKDINGFFKQFVVQNADIPDRTETAISHDTPGKDGVKVNGANLKNKGGNQIGVDMIVFGFGDNISAFTNGGALQAFTTFIEEGYPVLTAHDTLHYRLIKMQSRSLRNSFGMDVYGVSQNIVITPDPLDNAKKKIGLVNAWRFADPPTLNATNATTFDYLHSGTGYTRSGDENIFNLIESTGREVAYTPNDMRNSTVPETQGYTNTVIEHVKHKTASKIGSVMESWINAKGANNPGCTNASEPNQPDQDKYTVYKMNEGQITTYPYFISDHFSTAKSHSQWFALDLNSDKDNDGETDVVVWYALGENTKTGNGENPYSDTIGGSLDPARGYYIYSNGNVTYTGAGHDNTLSTAGAAEVQLFVNTLLAAYQTDKSAPSAGFYNSLDPDARPITSVAVPYDGNVTNPNLNNHATSVDSSVLKDKTTSQYEYKFVDANKTQDFTNGTFVYYRADDANFIRGTREIGVRLYLQIDEKNVIENTSATGRDRFTTKLPKGKNAAGATIYEDVAVSEWVEDDGSKIYVTEVTEKYKSYPVKGYNIDLQNPVTYYMYLREKETDTELKKYLSVDPGSYYAVYLPMDMLNENAKFTLIMEARTRITSVSTSGNEKVDKTDSVFNRVTVTKADLLDLD